MVIKNLLPLFQTPHLELRTIDGRYINSPVIKSIFFIATSTLTERQPNELWTNLECVFNCVLHPNVQNRDIPATATTDKRPAFLIMAFYPSAFDKRQVFRWPASSWTINQQQLGKQEELISTFTWIADFSAIIPLCPSSASGFISCFWHWGCEVAVIPEIPFGHLARSCRRRCCCCSSALRVMAM